MANKWEKLAGETGEELPSGRWSRMIKLGSLGMRVSASAVAGKVTRTVIPRSKEGRAEARRKSREKNANAVVRVLGQLKGASMKVGQMLSADPDMVPPEYVEALTSLQRDAPPMTYVTVKRQIEDALDRSIEDVFEFFEPEPIGSASIGQVHRGTLKDGREVAIKVQYLGVVESLGSDLKNLGSLMTLGRALVDKKRIDDWLGECRRIVMEEADYESEARNLRHWHEILSKREGLRSPEPVEEWTRKNVLMMEYVEGKKLDEALVELAEDERAKVLERWVKAYAWMFHELVELHCDPHPGNFLLDENNDLIILDFGAVKEFEDSFTDGILDILDAVWQKDDDRAARLYKEIGFGKDGADDSIYNPDLIRQYHDIILEPFKVDGDFPFGDWRPRAELQRFLLRHPSMIKLVPPADALMYLRVLSGIKGLLAKMGARFNIHRMAVETARRRGRLTAEPILSSRDC